MKLKMGILAAAAALALTGCLGGGGDASPATQPPATQPPATQPPATQPPATEPPAPGAVIAPTTAPVDSGNLTWAAPAAPTGAVANITQTGNLSFRFFNNLGDTQVWQASSGSTGSNTGELAFAPAPATNNQNLRVTYSAVGDAWTTSFFVGATTSTGIVDGMGNALVWCDDSVNTASVFEQTRVLLSHNVEQVSLATAQTNGLAAATTFDAIDCGHANLMTGGHRETLTVNADGTFTFAGGGADPFTITSQQVASLLGTGFNAGADRNIARIYQLTRADGSRQFYILMHAIEGGQQSLTLYM